ncbi:aldehyde oxidase and xanthine dehydrogenase, molybdopterin binding protein [Roseobacter sp. AzwK-3b]|uniref:xanthine dehydrogenase family protein molybdopterin-binding subunit n=1 Tax=Roseobacter sp. AzwK-3b TaxID=351016 RepID=UPI00015693AB|nr:molybdopterin cofactor-binding domain-containing protein [Roseobacter sp. AzwK-3b]EDM70966.1 aldehyde oxidase and xanthine dehydrogenase, molybdopterin binding protein [Roseobacter sp. AzwK-3b]
MSRAAKIARRSFLIGSAAVAGGVAFGVVLYRRPHDNPLLDRLEPGQAALTPYVLVTTDGVTLITPRADLGQGAYHLQAALIAEELDVALDQVTVDPGPPDPAYYNTALAGDAVPFPATDDGFLARTSRAVMDAPMKFMGIQITGGSTTVPDAWEKLRHAGAVARETLKVAAEVRTGTPRSAMRTENGAVILPDGSRLPYTDLAAEAAALEPVTDVVLRDPAQWRLIGQDMQRLDIVAKSTGTQGYGIDLRFDDMLHAAVRSNPRPGGAMLAHDATAARAMRGVQQIVPITGGIGVLADNSWRAMQAVQAIEIDWGPAPFPPEMDAHWQALADSFTDDRIDSRNRDDGDIDAALATSDQVSAEYRAPYLAHAPLEPVNATVRVTPERVDVWTATQIPRFMQTHVAEITGHDPADVHVHVQMAGGSFGHRLEDLVVRQAAELAMAAPGRPVKLTLSREEDMAHDYPRQIALARGRGAVAGGRVVACDLGIAMPSVIASQMGRLGLPVAGPDLQIVAGAWDQPFAIPHYRVTGYRAPALAPISSWRSVGASTNGFFHDCFLDELIHAAGADPLEERLRLCTHAPSRKVLEAVGEMSNWGSPLPQGRGRGVAYCLSFGVPCAEVVELTATQDGIRIDKVFVAAEVGRVIDPVNFENQVQGGVIWGLGHAIMAETTFSDGQIEQRNFDSFPFLRQYQCPEITVRGLENDSQVRGVGEPPVPPAAPALANAIFAATGQRLRDMPFNRHIDFV